MISHVKVVVIVVVVVSVFVRDLNIFLELLISAYTFSYCMNFSFQKSGLPSESYREICKARVLAERLFLNIY